MASHCVVWNDRITRVVPDKSAMPVPPILPTMPPLLCDYGVTNRWPPGGRSDHPCRHIALCLAGLLSAVLLAGCTSPQEYIRNGFKVGPNYCQPPAPVAQNWIDADDRRIRTECDDLSRWWAVFNDPGLNSLICCAYRQNLTLREAGCRVLQARAQWAIARGNFFPQTQNMTGDYTRNAASREIAGAQSIPQAFYSQWDFGFNLSWELDFWGRFRRAIESSADNLEASVADYDDVLVTLLGDVATNYVQMRTLEGRIAYAEANVRLQRETLTIVDARFRGGTTSELDVYQARSTLEQTEAQVPELEISLRQTINQLCILLGMPPEELQLRLGPASIPAAPPEVAIGIPADLLRRRPDVRRAERLAAAQCAQIGIAESDFYPAFSLNGTLGYSAERFSDLFKPSALNSSVGPSFQWNLFNYGRILNNVRLQDARFHELVYAYQQTVLNANQEVENGLVTFLKSQRRTKLQSASVDDAEKGVQIVMAQYRAGTVDFTRVTQLEQFLVQQQDVLTQARGEIATGLVQVYRALGGGWQIRFNGCEPTEVTSSGMSKPVVDSVPVATPEPVPPPKPVAK
jgi:NodT family efflux transporter outer membrane factor (OMF) lipoprotein